MFRMSIWRVIRCAAALTMILGFEALGSARAGAT
jgi:hypothetical protein